MYKIKITIKKESSNASEVIKIKVKDEDINQFIKVVTESFGVGEADRKILKIKK